MFVCAFLFVRLVAPSHSFVRFLPSASETVTHIREEQKKGRKKTTTLQAADAAETGFNGCDA